MKDSSKAINALREELKGQMTAHRALILVLASAREETRRGMLGVSVDNFEKNMLDAPLSGRALDAATQELQLVQAVLRELQAPSEAKPAH